jgi:hypothetical protein
MNQLFGEQVHFIYVECMNVYIHFIYVECVNVYMDASVYT